MPRILRGDPVTPCKCGMVRLLFISPPSLATAASLIRVYPLPVSTTVLIVLWLTVKLMMVGEVSP